MSRMTEIREMASRHPGPSSLLLKKKTLITLG